MSVATAQLLRLASPALPVGAYAWSGGLESAIAEGVVHDLVSAESWVTDQLELAQARWDAPVVWRLLVRPTERTEWNARYDASRETRELRAETRQIGKSLVDLLAALGHPVPPSGTSPPTFPWAWAVAAEAWSVAAEDALVAWLVATVENQLAVLQKALPLGQVATQRLFAATLPVIERVAGMAKTIDDAGLSSSTPGLARLSATHEIQYSRLFRS